MLNITPGQRMPISAITSDNKLKINVKLNKGTSGGFSDADLNPGNGIDYDFAIFGLDSRNKLSDDRYMTFFNQPSSPCGGVQLKKDDPSQCMFEIDFSKIPDSIQKLTLTTSVDPKYKLNTLQKSSILLSGSNDSANCDFSGDNFSEERAVMMTEFYKKNNEWRFRLLMQGFNDGLDALVRHFGGEVDEPTEEASPVKTAISLDKKVEKEAPALVSLAKKAQVSLDKLNLNEVKARVGLVLDASGSMNGQYRRGDVQELLNRVLPLAIHFDDDGFLDTWAFGEKTAQLNPVSMSNYSDFITTDNRGWKKWELGSRINCEWRAMQAVLDHYDTTNDKTPVYIIFVSDGGVTDNRAIKDMIVRSAHHPVFWQFVGIGGRSYGILESLDEMSGRVIDNCNFFAIDDLNSIPESVLYDRLMNEFPSWLKEAKQKNII